MPPDKRRRVALVLLSLLGALVVSQALLIGLFYERNFQRLAVDALAPETKVLVLGSSRVFYGVNPSLYSPKLMSLAGNYLDFRSARDLWRHYVGRVPGVKLAVVEFDLVSLALDARVLAPEGLYPLGLSLWPTFAEALQNPDKALRNWLSPIFRWRLTPAYIEKHRRIIYSAHEPQTALAGHVPSDLVLGAPILYAERKMRQGQDLLAKFGPETLATNQAALIDLARDASNRGVRVALLRFPLAAELRTVYPEAWHGAVAKAYADVAAALQADGLPAPLLWDLANDQRFEAPLFRDPDHLNSRGAVALAGILSPLLESALSPAFEGSSP